MQRINAEAGALFASSERISAQTLKRQVGASIQRDHPQATFGNTSYKAAMKASAYESYNKEGDGWFIRKKS